MWVRGISNNSINWIDRSRRIREYFTVYTVVPVKQRRVLSVYTYRNHSLAGMKKFRQIHNNNKK